MTRLSMDGLPQDAHDWLIDTLSQWYDTFEGEETPKGLNRVLRKLNKGEALTTQDHEEILFHLWQMNEV